jgi:hypothetical protein
MQHPKLLRSKCVRYAMIPAVALLCVIVSACADQEPTGPALPSIARNYSVSFDKFFLAWSQNHSSSPIQTQMFALDARQDRQYVDWYVDSRVLSFARANPGRLYIIGDEPDQWCVPAYDYAGTYHDAVAAVQGADPTARFSPAGFAEPNHYCCPNDEPCRSMHAISYAQQFYDAYVQRYRVAPPVNEWRFHNFGLSFGAGDVSGWWWEIDQAAAWSVAHGANMVLGAWGLLGWNEPMSDHQEHMKQAIGLLMNDTRINGSVYWSYEQWAGEHHYLLNGDGSLTPEGQTFVNPLTDIPTGLKVVGSANGQAKLRWSNTTSAWPAEVEFWVKAPGSNSFVYRASERVAGPGASQSPFVVLNNGDRVMGRVRYYNIYGQAAWSAFSDPVSLAMAEPDQGSVVGKRPLTCFLHLC